MSAHGITFGAPTIDLEALIGWKGSVVDRLTGGLDVLAKQRKVEVVRGEAQFDRPPPRCASGTARSASRTASSPPARSPR